MLLGADPPGDWTEEPWSETGSYLITSLNAFEAKFLVMHWQERRSHAQFACLLACFAAREEGLEKMPEQADALPVSIGSVR